MKSERVIKKFNFLKFKWEYYYQRYQCNYVDCWWETIQQLSKEDYEKTIIVLENSKYDPFFP